MTDFLNDLVDSIINRDKELREYTYKCLEKLGMDRITANMLAYDIYKERLGKQNDKQ